MRVKLQASFFEINVNKSEAPSLMHTTPFVFYLGHNAQLDLYFV